MKTEKILENFLNSEKKLISYPSKRKMRLYSLIYIASKFDTTKKYTEKEVNEIINSHTVFKDPATIRRELYNNFFINRTDNCKEYWLNENQPTAVSLKLEE